MAVRRSNSDSELHRRKRVKNYAILFALIAFMVLVYFVSIIRMSGG